MKRHFSAILLLICVVGFVLGVIHLFNLRFETGDVYPPYSSLRSDPLGASALYESLAQFPELRVSRDFRKTDELPEGANIAYLHLAGDEEELSYFPEDSFKKMDSFFNHGGRLVIAMAPETSDTFHSIGTSRTISKSKKSKNKTGTKSKPNKPQKGDKPADEETFFKTVSIMDKWGFHFQFKALKEGDNGSYEPAAVENSDESSLPDSVLWHSALVMTNLDATWRVIFDRDGDAVLAERKLDRGSVVIATDSFFLSNEAMSKDRHAELLAWLVGPCREVVFDEAHLGIVVNPGVAGLMRNYRLHGLVAGLLLLAGLFIWKNSVSFVPPLQEENVKAVVAGKDSAAGFINLLRRHVSPDDLLNLCVAEWKKSFGRGKTSPARLAKVEAVLSAQNSIPANARDPISAYRDICSALKSRSSQHATRNTQPASHHE